MQSPALKISNIVYGRKNRAGGRVEYLLNSDGSSDKYEIAENIVLGRWKKRVSESYLFGGTRMSPNIWRAIGIRFSSYFSKLEHLSEKDIDAITLNDTVTPSAYKVPNSKHLKIIFSALGKRKIRKICERHLSEERLDLYGTPDLFLWALAKNTQCISFIRLVEVKKPRERISKDQVEEIDYLKSLDIPARILRLIER
jgi:hypothetical protein